MDFRSTPSPGVKTFLEGCARDSDSLHGLLEGLLARLEDRSTHPEASQLLHQLVAHVEELAARGLATPFGVTRISLPPHHLELIQLPSVFPPDRWSYTFYEGISRMPRSEFEGHRVAELGAGNGWVTLALAHFGQPRKAYGLDINPRAILSARLNAHLNATRPDGTLILDAFGRSLLDRVEFHVSDVLTWCTSQNIMLDRIVGCIPQMLDPELEATAESVASRSGSDDFLYALSNYCGRQGFVEDQFGLGLMARVLEESIATLTPGGKVVFNLGGRPGRALLRHLFERRGYRVREIWRNRTPQAADTDIRTLVEIEARSSHRFEFFLGQQTEESVGARTAMAYADAGGTIFHSINVYEGELSYAAHVKRIFRALENPAFSGAHDTIDLAFGDDRVAEEKLSFLAELGEWLAVPRCFPYDATEGVSDFRSRLAEYLAHYFQASVGPETVVVTPTRIAALMALFACHRPRQALVDGELARLLPVGARTDATFGSESVLEAPRSLELCCQLLEKLKPGLLVVALTTPESHSLDALRHLVDVSRRTETALVLDISAGFDLSSSPSQHPALRLLAQKALPSHVSLLCGLVKDDVYRDLELGLLISENSSLLATLRRAAELTYSRAPLLVQRYYSRIIADLLSFRMKAQGPALRAPQAMSKPPAGFKALDHTSLQTSRLQLTADTVRLDYGENELPAPTCLRAALLEAFVRRQLMPQEVDVRPELVELLNQRFGLEGVTAPGLHLGGGIAPLYASLMRSCASEGATLIMPWGAYGYFAGAAHLAGARVLEVETFREDRFKLTAAALSSALEHAPERPWLYLNAPIVNPTGAIYEPEELRELVSTAGRAGATIVVDTVFSGLEFPANAKVDGRLLRLPNSLESTLGSGRFVLLGGISKELAAGGLRFGYGYTTSEALSDALAQACAYGTPHPTLLFAIKRTLRELLMPGQLTQRELSTGRAVLAERARLLCETLEACGWAPIQPQGGLFVLARATKYEGRSLTLPTHKGDRTYDLEGDGLVRALLEAAGLLINGPGFTGIPGYYRFVTSVEEKAFQRALAKIRQFDRLVEGDFA